MAGHFFGPDVLDPLFQQMRARGLAPREAQGRILEALKRGEEGLIILEHVAAGAWALQSREFTTREEEAQAQEEARAALKKYDYDAYYAIVYEQSPSPDGIIGPIEPEDWGVTVRIAIRDGHLVIEYLLPKFPPDSYTFAITPPEAVNELLAAASPAHASSATISSNVPVPRKRKRKRRAPQVELAGELMAMVFPQDGWRGMTPATVRHKCDLDRQVKAKLRKEEKTLPSTESFDRFMKLANARRR